MTPEEFRSSYEPLASSLESIQHQIDDLIQKYVESNAFPVGSKVRLKLKNEVGFIREMQTSILPGKGLVFRYVVVKPDKHGLMPTNPRAKVLDYYASHSELEPVN